MRILYYYSKLNIGGAERSTVRLLNLMAAHGHSVTLLLRWDGGPLEKDLSPSVRVIHLKKFGNKQGSKLRFVTETIRSLLRGRLLRNEAYDVAISGLFGYDPGFLLKSVVAEQYYQLLRNDVEKTGSFGKTEEYMRRYGDRFDAYIGVSEYTTESFCRCYPQFADRATTIYNILPNVDMSQEARKQDPYPGPKDVFRIVTVCRLADQAKGLFRMVRVCSALYNEFGDSFCWYIVGKGPDEEALKQKINEAGLNSVMILCGEADDPFPYYAHADMVAVFSYNEGLCGVVNEAKLMCKPVVATRFSGIEEQIISGKNGIIVDNDEISILTTMRCILSDPSVLSSMHCNGMPIDLLDNDKKVEKFVFLYRSIKGEQ